MTIEISDNTYYLEYVKKRDSLPLCYCYNPYIIHFEKGFYRYERIDEDTFKVYNTHRGVILSKQLFEAAFRNPNKLQLFLYKYFDIEIII